MSPSGREERDILNMSAKELSRSEVMQRLSRKEMSQKEAGEILHLAWHAANKAIAEVLSQTGSSGCARHFVYPRFCLTLNLLRAKMLVLPFNFSSHLRLHAGASVARSPEGRRSNP
jgi:hypothetical protein